jgi:Na+/H+ antiporter NhaD/arsenite permease-like protein
MVLSPLAAGAADPASSWLILAMASTFAGNLTLLGSVANLIVAEGAASRGARLGFWDYLKAGVPITILTLVVGTVWLYLTA